VSWGRPSAMMAPVDGMSMWCCVVGGLRGVPCLAHNAAALAQFTARRVATEAALPATAQGGAAPRNVAYGSGGVVGS
jgi:hypothetical protein